MCLLSGIFCLFISFYNRYVLFIYNTLFDTSGTCDYGGHCLALAKAILESTPNALVNCQRGRQGKLLIINYSIHEKIFAVITDDINANKNYTCANRILFPQALIAVVCRNEKAFININN